MRKWHNINNLENLYCCNDYIEENLFFMIQINRQWKPEGYTDKTVEVETVYMNSSETVILK